MLKYINIGDAHIPSYNLLVGVGIALAMLFLQYDKWFLSRTEKERNNIQLSLVLSVTFGFSGAFVFDAFTQNIELRAENLNRIGLTFFSGLLSGIVLLTLSSWLFRLPIPVTLNKLTPYFCIAHIFGRVGCFMAGCCYGAPTTLFTGISFPEGSMPYQHYHATALHPAQLYESFFVVLIFLFLKINKPRQAFAIYLLSYSVFRFLLEFIRADNRGTVWAQAAITPSQLLSAATIVAVLSIMALYRNSSRLRSNR